MPAEAVWPRLMTAPHPRAVGTLGPEFEQWCKSEFGRRLRWFQRLVAYRLLEVDADGRLVWWTLILTLARQLGKSTLLSALLLWRMRYGRDMVGEVQVLLHTGRDLRVCREVQRDGRLWAKARPELFKVIEANGKESVEDLASGSRWLVLAEDSCYGMSGTAALVDECWDVAEATVDEGIEPTLISHEQPQLLLTSTAHRKATTLMPAKRAAALEVLAVGEDELLIEWSAPRGSNIEDRAAWRMASPHWDARREKLIARKVAKALAGEMADEDPDETDPIEAILTQWLNIWPVRGTPRGPGEPLFAGDEWEQTAEDPGEAEPVAVVVAVEDNFGHGAGVVTVTVLDDDRRLVSAWTCESRDVALADANELIDGCEVPAQMVVSAAVTTEPGIERMGFADVKRGLSLLRSLTADGRVLLGDADELTDQIAPARVRESADGLNLVTGAGRRSDLVRALAWALRTAEDLAGAPAIY